MDAPKFKRLVDDAEWDAFSASPTIRKVTHFGPHCADFGEVVVVRGSSGEMSALLKAKGEVELLRQLWENQPNELPNGYVLRATSDVFTLELSGVILNSLSTSHSPTGGETGMSLQFRVAAESRTTDAKAATVTEWYMSGPDPLMYARGTTREYAFSYARRRRAGSSLEDDAPRLIKPKPGRPDSSSATDYFLLTPCDGVRAILAKVPDGYGPSWSRNVSIEYAGELLPSEDLRRGVAEGVGMFFGRRLLQIGQTTFDENGYAIARKAWSPWARDAEAIARAPDQPMIPCEWNNTERLLNAFLEAYLRLRAPFRLSKFASAIWYARQLPVGPDLALYSLALERLMNAWFKSTRSKSGGIYMEQAKFDALLAEHFDAIARKLDAQPFADRIIRRMQGTFQMGVNERFDAFFEELGLPCSPGERKVIRARNKAAHGGDDDDPYRSIGRTKAYKTLLNRVLLQVLGHQGSYIDYSVDHTTAKPMQDPSAGAP
jgi:hypothetical protein